MSKRPRSPESLPVDGILSEPAEKRKKPDPIWTKELSEAFRKQDMEVVSHALEEFPCLCNTPMNYGGLGYWSPSQIAAMKGSVPLMKLLIDNGASVSDGEALCWSVSNDHFDVACLLLECGADVHANDNNALITAAITGNVKITRLLLVHGANVRAQNDEALRCSIKNGHLEVTKVLLTLYGDAEVHALSKEYPKIKQIYKKVIQEQKARC